MSQYKNFLKPLFILSLAGWISFQTHEAQASCPIVVSTDTSLTVNDVGQANCNITINDGVSVLTSGGTAVAIFGDGSSLINNGTISSFGAPWSIYSSPPSSGSSSINNTGTVSADSGAAIRNNRGQLSLLNSGTITGSGTYTFYNLATVSNFINSGIISNTNAAANAAIENAIISTFVSLENTSSGTISGTNGIWNRGLITTLNNSGTISGTRPGNAGGIYNGSNGVITTLINSGTISNPNGYGIFNNSNDIVGIQTLTNTGTISGGLFGINNSDVGGIDTLNNQQGSSSSALSLTGKLPLNYNVIIASTSNYGQLSVDTVTGVTQFGISSLSTSNSSILNTNFSSVLSGITADQLGQPGVTRFSGTSNGYTFTLSLTDILSNTWGLIITRCTSCETIINSGTRVTLNEISNTTTPELAGGTLVLFANDNSNLRFTVAAASTIEKPITGTATLTGVLSGSAGLTMSGAGTLVLSGANTYTGGTTVSAGTLSVEGESPTGSGDVLIAAGAKLMGRGVILGRLNVNGILKPGNSPGFLSASSTVTMNAGSTYQQDIAGTVQASSTSPVGSSGYYSFLNATNGDFVIQPGATLTPQLSNLFSIGQPGYGSAIFVPSLGDRFRIVTASGGISGKFSTVTQPAELASGTQFLPFYNMLGSNSIDLAVVPSSYVDTIASASGNANAQSVGGALTQIAQSILASTSSTSQEQLLYSIAGQTNALDIAKVAQELAGEVYAATVGVIAQTTQRVQQSVLGRLGDTAGLPMSHLMNHTGDARNTSVTATSSATVSVPVNAAANTVSANKNVWGDLTYQRGNRASDSQSGGWNSNLYQLTFGSDIYASQGTILGAGVSLSSTTLNPVYGAATIQQGALFAYGKLPVDPFVLDAMASIGLSSSDIARGDITGLSNGFRNKSVSGNDALVSLGLSHPLELDSVRITPYARVTWQMVKQSAVKEDSQGNTASALYVDRYTGNGVRGVIGVAAGSKVNNPMTAKHTYRAFVGIGMDSSGLLNPTLNASLAGINTQITTPDAGRTFVQAGLYGTARISENTFAYAGISGEARRGQTLGTVNLGLRVQF